MATAFIEVVDEGNDLVYVFDNEDDYDAALEETDGDVGLFFELDWVLSRAKNIDD